jgi:peptidoglycan hydrolase-like protein with peptidoglycan-binding domain
MCRQFWYKGGVVLKKQRQKTKCFGLILWVLCLTLVWNGSLVLSAHADDSLSLAIAVSEETDVRVGQVQEWLEQLGYYQGDHTMLLDANTQYALYSFCKANGLSYTNAGVTQDAWNLLQSGNGTPAPDDSETYQDIAYGAEGDEVLVLQTRLKELGYFVGDNVLEPSVFDGGTQGAVELFCENNNVAYSGAGVSASFQHIIFSSGAISYSEPTVKKTAAEKLTAYMTRRVPVLGSTLPMFFIWICSVVVVVLILVLSVYFFVPDKEKLAAQKTNNGTTQQYWRKTVTDTTGSGLMAMEKLSASGNLLDFQVHYNGDVRNIQCVCKGTLAIGRGENCQITLHPSDTAASHSHCDLYYRGAVLMLRDHSSNGTYVNGRMIHKSECRIHSGDHITIGSHLLVIQF